MKYAACPVVPAIGPRSLVRMRLKAGCAAMTFLEAFTKYGPDVERIGEALGITPQEADRLINDLMDRRYQKRAV